MSTTTNGKHKRIAKVVTLPEGTKCSNCGALTPTQQGMIPVKAEINTRTCYGGIERNLCGPCESVWRASEDLNEWSFGLASTIPELTLGHKEQLSSLCVIPEDCSASAVVQRLRLLNDASTVCRQVFLALGARS